MEVKIKPKILILRISFALIPLLILYFLFKNIISDWKEVKNYAVNTNYYLIMLSLLSFSLANSFMIWVWFQILKKFDIKVNFLTSLSIWSISSLGKYIPGKGWQFLGVMYLGEKLGINLEISGASSIMGQIITILTGVLIAFPLVEKYLNLWSLLILIPFILIFLYPPFLNRALLFLARKTGRKFYSFDIKIKEIIFFGLLYTLGWFIFGISFYFLIKSIEASWTFNIFYCTRIYIVSYLLGLFAIFVPGGIGVREGVMMILLKDTLPSYLASYISIIARIVVTIAELFLTLIGIYFLKRHNINIFKLKMR
jgi:hypothetical protein